MIILDVSESLLKIKMAIFCSAIKICKKDQKKNILKELSKTINEDCADEFGSHTI